MAVNQLHKNINGFRENLLKGTYIDIYGDDYSTDIHAGKLFIHLYNELCYTYLINTPINVETFVRRLDEKYHLNTNNYILRSEVGDEKRLKSVDHYNSQYLIKVKDKLLVEIHNYRVAFWYGMQIDFKELEDIIEIIQLSKKKRNHSRKFYMIANSSHSEFGFDLQKFDVKRFNVDINENYNEDFVPVHTCVNEFLRSSRNGLILLHGKYGSGKTTYLRYLISNINKRFIYLPLNLMDAISSPNFLPFISQYKDSILILEDCEDLLIPRDSGQAINTTSLVNLLNLGDGLLSDALAIKLICTFNANLKQIDKAILRKGRLVVRYEFNELEIPKVQNIFNKLGYPEKATKPMVLADIYNKNSEDYGISKEKKIGF